MKTIRLTEQQLNEIIRAWIATDIDIPQNEWIEINNKLRNAQRNTK